ncbi:MAG: transglutaminase domain-containing protein [Phycisphaerales bacterium]|nr:transglutaminase domain-containing protein [Phycisphaerales bacterium]
MNSLIATEVMVACNGLKQVGRFWWFSFYFETIFEGFMLATLSRVKQIAAAMLVVSAVLCGGLIRADGTSAITPAQKKLLVWHFDQCSYNALGSVLTYFYGPGPVITNVNRDAFEKKTFFDPLNSTGYGGYYGWAPWTSKMVDSGRMVWNGHRVTNLIGANFSLATHLVPKVLIGRVKQTHQYVFFARVAFEKGERHRLIARLQRQLQKGPVLIWTPYAAVLDGNNRDMQWHQVKRMSPGHYLVPFSPQLTHAVAVFAIPHSNKVLVVDGSDLHGVYQTSASTVVCTAAAMSASVRLKLGGGTIISRCGDMYSDRFDVVFYKPKHAAFMPLMPLQYRAQALGALAKAGANRASLAAGYGLLPPNQRSALSFLIGNMPLNDLKTLSGNYLAIDVALAYQAMAPRPWHSHVSNRIFLQYVLPYANLDEKRDGWRKQLGPMCQRLVAGCRSAGAAALMLNKKLFPLLHVSYDAQKRPIPNESPSQSILSHYDSCTGLSILLADACRSVGVPARIVGTPMWAVHRGDANGNNAGNHTWVEIWDGQWHVLGASEVSPLDKTWFLRNASLAYGARLKLIDGIYAHRIYTAVFKRKPITPGNWFPMVWDLNDHTVYADDVSADYDHRELVSVRVAGSGKAATSVVLVLHRQGRLVANLSVHGRVKLWLSAGGHYAAQVRLAGKTSRKTIVVPQKAPFAVELSVP